MDLHELHLERSLLPEIKLDEPVRCKVNGHRNERCNKGVRV